MKLDVQKAVDGMLDKLVRRYAAQCWWAEVGDLKQQAWLVACEADTRFKPERAMKYAETTDDPQGALLGIYLAYLWRAAALGLRNYLWAQSAPVSGPKRRGEKLEGLRRADVALIDGHLADDTSPEAIEAWWAELRAQVAAAVRDGPGGALAEAVVLRRRRTAEVAAGAGVTYRAVSRAARAARERVRTDLKVRELLATGA